MTRAFRENAERSGISERWALGTSPKEPMNASDDFRLRLGEQELVPIMVGGMGVDISTASSRSRSRGSAGSGHISDAMITAVADRRFDTQFVKAKLERHRGTVAGWTNRR